MKKNLAFIAKQLALLAICIGSFGIMYKFLDIILNTPYLDPVLHYTLVWISVFCIVSLIFGAFYIAHNLAVRDYKYYSNIEKIIDKF